MPDSVRVSKEFIENFECLCDSIDRDKVITDTRHRIVGDMRNQLRSLRAPDTVSNKKKLV